jgi:hypothetical protein
MPKQTANRSKASDTGRRPGVATRVHESEPALVYAALTGVAGFLVQTGLTDVDTMQALATSGGLAGLQGALTRQRVYAPAGAKKKGRKPVSGQDPAPLPGATFGLNQAEPTLGVAVAAGLAGFLAQVAAGVEPMGALSAAAGISGTQGVLTRQTVHAPGSVTRQRWRTTANQLRPRAQCSVFAAATGDDAESEKTVPITKKEGEGSRVVMSLPLEGARPHSALAAPGDVLKVGVELEVTVDAEQQADSYHDHYTYSPLVQAELLLASDPEKNKADPKNAIRLGGSKPERVGHALHHHVVVIEEQEANLGALVGHWAKAYLNLVLSAWDEQADGDQVLLVGENEPHGPPEGNKGRINVIRFRPQRPNEHPKRTTEEQAKQVPLLKDQRTLLYSLRLDNLKANEQLWLEAELLTRSRLTFPARISTQLLIADSPKATSPGGQAAEICAFRGEVAKFNGTNCLPRDTHKTHKLGVMRLRRDAGRPLYANLVATSSDPFRRGPGGENLEVLNGGYVQAVRYPASWTG